MSELRERGGELYRRGDTDCFHDSSSALICVLEARDYLRDDDALSAGILGVVLDTVLSQNNPADRLSAGRLFTRLVKEISEQSHERQRHGEQTNSLGIRDRPGFHLPDHDDRPHRSHLALPNPSTDTELYHASPGRSTPGVKTPLGSLTSPYSSPTRHQHTATMATMSNDFTSQVFEELGISLASAPEGKKSKLDGDVGLDPKQVSFTQRNLESPGTVASQPYQSGETDRTMTTSMTPKGRRDLGIASGSLQEQSLDDEIPYLTFDTVRMWKEQKKSFILPGHWAAWQYLQGRDHVCGTAINYRLPKSQRVSNN